MLYAQCHFIVKTPPKICKVYELSEAVDAHEDVERGHGAGKVVFRIED